jgi:hypothetical protein
MNTIQTCAEGFVSHISTFAGDARPHEANLEFGLAFTAEAGIVVTKVAGDANFKVGLTWKEAGGE